MAKKKAAKRSVSKQRKPPKAAKPVKVTRSGKAVTISFSKPEEVIPHLLTPGIRFRGQALR
jgi:hypothetical protein